MIAFPVTYDAELDADDSGEATTATPVKRRLALADLLTPTSRARAQLAARYARRIGTGQNGAHRRRLRKAT